MLFLIRWLQIRITQIVKAQPNAVVYTRTQQIHSTKFFHAEINNLNATLFEFLAVGVRLVNRIWS